MTLRAEVIPVHFPNAAIAPPRRCLLALLIAPLFACANAPIARSTPPTEDPAPQLAQEKAVRFCAHTVMHHGIDECLGEVPAEAQPHRTYTYRVQMQGGRPSSIARINGAGLRLSLWEYRYEGDRLAETVERD